MTRKVIFMGRLRWYSIAFTMTLFINDYSERAISITGDTMPHREQLAALNGRWNRYTNCWFFSKKRRDQVEALVEQINQISGDDKISEELLPPVPALRVHSNIASAEDWFDIDSLYLTISPEAIVSMAILVAIFYVLF